MKKSTKEIRNLAILFFLSFLTSGLIASYLILNYGPTGTYSGKNTVIAPDVLKQLKFSDNRLKSPFKILFDKIEFKISEKTFKVDPEAYTRFYLLISSDESLDEKNMALALFNKQLASLIVFTKPEKILKGEPESYPFQRIEFAEGGDHYRVQLLGDSNYEWAYFEHKGILDKAVKLLTPSR